MQTPIDRHEYGRIYNQLFRKDSKDCRQGWKRWQRALRFRRCGSSSMLARRQLRLGKLSRIRGRGGAFVHNSLVSGFAMLPRAILWWTSTTRSNSQLRCWITRCTA
jgi:hypothetical protein